MAQGMVTELFKKGESRFQTVGQPGCLALGGFVIPRGGGWDCWVCWAALRLERGGTGTERAAAGC